SISAEALYQYESDAFAESGPLIADRENEGADDEPHSGVAIPFQRPSEGSIRQTKARLRQLVGTEQHKARQHVDEGETDQRDGRTRQGFQDQADNDTGKNGKVIPGMLR